MRMFSALLLTILLIPSVHAQTWTWIQSTGSHPVVANMRQGSALVYAAPKEDELSEWQPLPFPFTFAGEAVTGYFISDNGYITFDPAATVSEPSNESGTVRNAIFGYNAGTDAAISATLSPAVVKVNTPTSIRGTVKNLGTTSLTDFSLYYSIDGAQEQEMQVSGVSLGTNETWDFSHDVIFTPANAGHRYTIAMRIQLGNGQTDENPSNDTLTSTVFCILGVSSAKRVLVEEFTGAWCGWCPDGALQLEKLLQTHPLAIPVAIHAGGTDAMMLPQGEVLTNAFEPSFPMAMIDRMHFDGEAGVPIARTRDAWITRTGEQFSAYTPLSVSVTGTYDLEAFGGYMDVDVTFSDFAPPGDYRIHCWLLRESMTGSGRGWDQANSFSNHPSYPDHPFFSLPNPVPDYEHRHVPILMSTGAWGMPGEIPDSPQASATYSKRFLFTHTGIDEATRLRVVAFVTRHSEDVLDRPVLNATTAELAVKAINPTPFSRLLLTDLFPQPATGTVHAILSLPRTTAVHAAVYDVLGRERLIVRDGRLDPGSHAISFSTAGLENGLYLLRVVAEGYAKTTPMLVSR